MNKNKNKIKSKKKMKNLAATHPVRPPTARHLVADAQEMLAAAVVEVTRLEQELPLAVGISPYTCGRLMTTCRLLAALAEQLETLSRQTQQTTKEIKMKNKIKSKTVS